MRAQMKPVWEYGAYNKKQGHACAKKCGKLVKALLIRKEKVSDHNRNKSKPQKIRNNKIFNKRNVII